MSQNSSNRLTELNRGSDAAWCHSVIPVSGAAISTTRTKLTANKRKPESGKILNWLSGHKNVWTSRFFFLHFIKKNHDSELKKTKFTCLRSRRRTLYERWLNHRSHEGRNESCWSVIHYYADFQLHLLINELSALKMYLNLYFTRWEVWAHLLHTPVMKAVY